MTSPVRRLFLAGLLAIAAIPTARAEPTTVRFRGTVVRADSERLVRVHDFGELPDGRPYQVMTYAGGGTLADRLDGGLMPIGTAR